MSAAAIAGSLLLFFVGPLIRFMFCYGIKCLFTSVSILRCIFLRVDFSSATRAEVVDEEEEVEEEKTFVRLKRLTVHVVSEKVKIETMCSSSTS